MADEQEIQDPTETLAYWKEHKKELSMTHQGRFAQIEMEATVAHFLGERLITLTGAIDELKQAEKDGTTEMNKLTGAYKNATIVIAVATILLVAVGVAQFFID